MRGECETGVLLLMVCFLGSTVVDLRFREYGCCFGLDSERRYRLYCTVFKMVHDVCTNNRRVRGRIQRVYIDGKG